MCRLDRSLESRCVPPRGKTIHFCAIDFSSLKRTPSQTPSPNLQKNENVICIWQSPSRDDRESNHFTLPFRSDLNPKLLHNASHDTPVPASPARGGGIDLESRVVFVAPTVRADGHDVVDDFEGGVGGAEGGLAQVVEAVV